MSHIAIHCEALGKRYRLGERIDRSLREALMKRMVAPFQRKAKAGHATLWALRDVAFDVGEGEVVGIIGRNGAGKSTLLKLLSRITEPTEGFAEVHGRVGSLLEVGTGFHPELTGRENIFLNGAILGMRKAEIERKFDEIVDFAEVEKFLDTPVKHYSSGMHVRLGFSVAAHLETEIMLVDEVLAVGDAQFQKKCFEKVRSVGRSGRTILFISHNMAALRQICERGIVLDGGKLVADGRINEVADRYLESIETADRRQVQAETPTCTLHEVRVKSLAGPVIKTFDPVEVRVRFTAKKDLKDPGMYIAILNGDNVRLAGLVTNDLETFAVIAAGETVDMGFIIDSLPLLGGTYHLEVQFRDPTQDVYDFVRGAFPFEVAETPVYGTRKLDGWMGTLGLRVEAFSSPSGSQCADTHNDRSE
jgi:lipopolysaccharide transport system ATP-binding protein